MLYFRELGSSYPSGCLQGTNGSILLETTSSHFSTCWPGWPQDTLQTECPKNVERISYVRMIIRKKMKMALRRNVCSHVAEPPSSTSNWNSFAFSSFSAIYGPHLHVDTSQKHILQSFNVTLPLLSCC